MADWSMDSSYFAIGPVHPHRDPRWSVPADVLFDDVTEDSFLPWVEKEAPERTRSQQHQHPHHRRHHRQQQGQKE